MPWPAERSTSDDMRLIPYVAGRMLRTKSFFVVLALGLLATVAAALHTRPVYRSESVLVYQQTKVAGASAPLDTAALRRNTLALQAMLLSHARLQKLIEEFALYPGVVGRQGMVAAAEEMRERDLHLSARDASTVRVSFQSTSPDLAQSVTARAAELLVQANADLRRQTAQDAKVYLGKEKERAEQELRSHEAEVAAFVAQHPEVAETATPDKGAPAPSAASTSTRTAKALPKGRAATEKSPTTPAALITLRAQYANLQREARKSRDYRDLLVSDQLQTEVSLLLSSPSTGGDLVLVDPATKPVIPSSSARHKILAEGMAASLLIAIAISLVLVLRDDRLRRAADLRHFGLPTLLCEVPPP